MIDFASITYLPDTKSKSESNFVISLTNAFTLSIEFKHILTVFINITSSLNRFSIIIVVVIIKISLPIPIYYILWSKKSTRKLIRIF